MCVATACAVAGCVAAFWPGVTFFPVYVLLGSISAVLLLIGRSISIKNGRETFFAFASCFLIISATEWARYGPGYSAFVPGCASVLSLIIVFSGKVRRKSADDRAKVSGEQGSGDSSPSKE
jgi:hypothetical protein